MTITDERKKNVDFSDPYFDATQALLAKKERHQVPRGPQGQEHEARRPGADHRRDYAKSKGFDPVSFESSDAVLNGLRTGQVDAVVIDYPVVQGWLKTRPNAAAFEVADHQHR